MELGTIEPARSGSMSTGILVGLFDFRSHADLVEAVSRLLNLPTEEVKERLFYEAIETGWNTNRAIREFQVTPHVYNERMQAFYKGTDSFVFELVVSHLTPGCEEIDRRVAEAIEVQYPNPKNLRILAFGDGIGTDALRLAAMGHDAAYFEFEGPSSRFAQYRFGRLNLEDRIQVLHSPEGIPLGAFDVVVCREVLEHAVDPPSVVAHLREHLRDAGIAVITESFARVEPNFPTHLAENRKYAGRTERLFVEIGFRLLHSYPDRRPMVFQKTALSDRSRFDSLEADRQYAFQNVIRRVGRYVLRFVRF